MPSRSTPPYALRFISGKYQGGEFPLKADREIIIGRSSGLDMVLVEDMVSRKHAKISTADGQIIIQDMGSTNGTFVNGEKIKRVRLREGDRILIGTSIIKLVTLDGSGPAGDGVEEGLHTPPPSPQSTSPGRTVAGIRSMAGTIEEIPLPDVIQLLSTSKKSGVIEVRGEDGTGRIFMRGGAVYFATIDEAFEITPHKAIYRMLVWTRGSFELQSSDDQSFDNELDEPTEDLIMEAMRQLDELKRLEDQMPTRDTRLRLAQPIATPLRDLTAEELDLVQLVHNFSRTGSVVDRSARTDLDTANDLVKLLDAKVISVDQ